MPPAERWRRIASERLREFLVINLATYFESYGTKCAEKSLGVATWGGENRRGAEERRRADEDFARLGENDQHY